MSRGLAYDSDEGRAYAATLTAIMTGEAYRQSAVIARDHGGPFNDYAINEQPFLRVIGKHRDAAYGIPGRCRRPSRSSMPPGSTWDEALAAGSAARLPQRAGVRAGAHRHHRVHDGLRYHRHRARHRARQVQEAGRRGLPQDRQQHGPRGAPPAGLHPRRDAGDRRPHQRARDHRGRSGAQARAPVGVRLRLQARQRRALHPLHGPRPDDGCDAAVPLGRHQQDRQHARGRHRRRTSRMSTCRAGSWASRPSPSIATAASDPSRSPPARRRSRSRNQ